MKRSGFTMIELIFVIVILGILAAVAIPRLAATRDDAKISKIEADAATFIQDVGSYYTSKGTYGTAQLKDVTNVQFGTTAAPTATTTAISAGAFNLTDGAQTCLTFTLGTTGTTTDGNMTVAAGAGTSAICTAVKADTLNLQKTHQFGGTGVNR